MQAPAGFAGGTPAQRHAWLVQEFRANGAATPAPGATSAHVPLRVYTHGAAVAEPPPAHAEAAAPPVAARTAPQDLTEHMRALGIATDQSTGSIFAARPETGSFLADTAPMAPPPAPSQPLWVVPESAEARTGDIELTRQTSDVTGGAFDAAAEAAVTAAVQAQPPQGPEPTGASLRRHSRTGSLYRQRSERSQPLVSTARGKRGWECVICMERRTEGLVSLHCGHVFHGACLLRALAAQRVCPVCREEVEDNADIRRVFL